MKAIEIMAVGFNNIIQTAIIPESWKECKVIPLQKPRKPSNLASSKRPISIFGKVRRIFESCLLERPEKWAEKEKKFSPTQYGFRKGKSTRDCVAILTADIKIAFNEKKMVGAVFLDVTAAYDNVDIESSVIQMNQLGAPKNICILMWHLYSKKINRYVVNNTIVGERISSIGFPQGLPSSPLSFNLALAKIDDEMDDDVSDLQFADDATIYYASRYISEIERKLNQTIINLVHFSSKLGLTYSKEKTKSVLFSRKHTNEVLSIRMEGQEIEQVECVTYLGVKMDRKLSMNQQMRSSADSASKAINVMRSVAGTKWGVDPRCLDMLYKGCVSSKLEYCSFIYPRNKSIDKLEKVQWQLVEL